MKRKRIYSLLISLILVFGVSISSVMALTVTEIKGQDRYETSALISDKQSYSTAILVNTTKSIADGLSASALSGAANAPIMFVKSNSIPNEVALRLECTNHVYIIGSETAINTSVENTLKNAGFMVTRIGGSNRYETSVNVAKEVKRIKGGADKAFIVNGLKGEADAMSISSVAARDSAPVILTNGTSITNSALDVIKGINNKYIIGLEGVVSNSIKTQTNAVRIGGENRFATNKEIIGYFYKNVTSFHLSKSDQFVDALAAAPITKYKPIVLVSKNGDKSVLHGATELVALGGIDKDVIEKCKEAAQN